MTYTPKPPRRVILAAKVEPQVKAWVVKQAKKEGLTPSDWVHQTLRNLHAKGGKHAND